MAKTEDSINFTDENKELFVGVNPATFSVHLRSKDVRKMSLEEAEYVINSVFKTLKNKLMMQRNTFIAIDIIQFVLLIAIIIAAACK